MNISSIIVNSFYFDVIPGSRSIFNEPEDVYETIKFTKESVSGKLLSCTFTATRTSENGTTIPNKLFDKNNFMNATQVF